MEDLERHITEAHLEWDGGYPYDSAWIGRKFVVAEIDHDGATNLNIYAFQQMKKWIRVANKWRLEIIAKNEQEDHDDITIFHDTSYE